MPLTLGPLLLSAGIRPTDALVIRHAFVREHEESGLAGIQADSTDEEILHYTSRQSLQPRSFPTVPTPVWVIFVKEGGNRARFWSVLHNRGEEAKDGRLRSFDLSVSDLMVDLRNRLVIGWKAPRSWWLNGATGADYPVMEIADSEPVPFPGFDGLVLSHAELQAVMREHRYTSWRTALSSVKGVYLITDTQEGRQYVGKADGGESIRQRWSAYAANGHGGNVELRRLDPTSFRFSLIRVFDPATSTRAVDAAEGHFK